MGPRLDPESPPGPIRALLKGPVAAEMDFDGLVDDEARRAALHEYSRGIKGVR